MIVSALLGVCIAAPFAMEAAINFLAGEHNPPPASLEAALSPEANALVKEALRDLPETGWLDYHTHIIGVGEGETGAWVNPAMRSLWNPLRYLRLRIFQAGAGVRDLDKADSQYLARLLALIRSSPKPGRHVILPFDASHTAEGLRDLEHTDFYVPNEYAFALAKKHPDIFIPAISVHPYRLDATEELRTWAARGGRVVKWLPNAMGIDPADPRCDPYYEVMRELGLVLLSHAGDERAVESEDRQTLGNPLRLRRPLDKGVRVIVAHCAGLGMGEDLDNPNGQRVANFDLFLRLVEDERYRGRVFGDISAMTLVTRCGRPLRTLLERPELHRALLYGSDYPVPAVDILVQTGKLVSEGYITNAQVAALEEVYEANPLLFNYVLMRTLRAPGKGGRLSSEIFSRQIF